MSELEKQIGNLFTAELQFRLASAVRLAVTGNRQPLDLPMEWTHGRHRVRYKRSPCAKTRPTTRPPSFIGLPPT